MEAVQLRNDANLFVYPLKKSTCKYPIAGYFSISYILTESVNKTFVELHLVDFANGKMNKECLVKVVC